MLADTLRLTRTSPGVWERECDRTFWGHRSQFGGYAQALMLSAMREELVVTGDPLAEPKSPQSMTMHFLRPFLDGPFRVEVTVERNGRNTAVCSARSFTRGELAGVGVAGFGTHRDVATFVEATMPAVAPFEPEEVPTHPQMGIPVVEQFRFWPRIGGFDFGSGSAVAGGWVLPRFDHAPDHALVTMLADLWLPAAYRRWQEPARAVSADITVHFRSPLPAGLPEGTPLLVVLRTAQSRHGFVDEDGEIWSPDGELLAQSRQVRFVSPL